MGVKVNGLIINAFGNISLFIVLFYGTFLIKTSIEIYKQQHGESNIPYGIK